MFGLGVLSNEQIAILRRNAYDAARTALGTPGSRGTINNIVVSQVAETYVTQEKGKLDAPLSKDQILQDPDFLKIVHAHGGGGGQGWDFSPMGSMIGGVPNYLLYGGMVLASVIAYGKSRRGGAAKSGKRRSKRRKSSPRLAPPIAMSMGRIGRSR